MKASIKQSPLTQVFIAVPVTGAPAQALHRRARRHATTGARLTAPANYHVTLAFLGQVSAGQLQDLADGLARLAPRPALSLAATAITRFPAANSRLLAAVIESEDESLAALWQDLDPVLTACGIDAERRGAFRPHITLARGLAQHRGNAASHSLVPPLRWSATWFGVFEGHQTEAGYRYQCLCRISCNAGSSRGKP